MGFDLSLAMGQVPVSSTGWVGVGIDLVEGGYYPH